MTTNNSINAPTNAFMPLAGGTMLANLNMGGFQATNAADPTSPQSFATKNYVDQTALNGTSVYAATTTNLNVTQSGAGVGATLTDASGTFAAFTIDGASPPVGAPVLVKNLSIAASHQGIYTLTRQGDTISVPYQLTRSTDYDTATEVNLTGLIVIQNGSTLQGTAWYNAATIVTMDVTNFSFSQFGNITFPIALTNGGTNASLTASNGGIFYSTATAGAILAGTATPGLALLSGASAPPTWSTAPPITKVVTREFTVGTSTYTPTTGMQFCTTQICGGGGAGGSVSGAVGQGSTSGAGGGGGYCIKTYTAANIGSSATVVVGSGGTPGTAGNNPGGNGGTSTFTCSGTGVTLTATGGTGGSGAVASATIGSSSGGSGGTGTNGDINITGGQGGDGLLINGANNIGVGGMGGGTPLGSSVGSAVSGGNQGQLYGGGASGYNNVSTSNQQGRSGAAAICYVTEYISV